MSEHGLVVDIFAGGGGASVGIEAALGHAVDVAINHDATALAVHKANHPGTRHIESDVWDVRPEDVVGDREVDLLWASPDCTHFSTAKGGKPRDKKIRSLAWVVVDWARRARPRVICLENVREFQTWGPLDGDGLPCPARKGETFNEWVLALERLGYAVESRMLDASHFGAPTSRRRLFVVARRDGEPVRWPAPTHGEGLAAPRTAAECVDWALPCPSIFERKKPLAAKTLARVAEGVRRYVIEDPDPFIVGPAAHTLVQTGYGERRGQAPRVPGLHKPLGTVVAGASKHALVSAFLAKHYGGVVGKRLDAPLGTITARDGQGPVAATLVKYYGTATGQSLAEPLHTVTGKARFALVAAMLRGHGVDVQAEAATVTVRGERWAIADVGLRMLQPHELLAAQFGEYAAAYDLSAAGTKTAMIRLVGNSVCPHVAAALVRANATGEGAEAVEARQGTLFGV